MREGEGETGREGRKQSTEKKERTGAQEETKDTHTRPGHRSPLAGRWSSFFFFLDFILSARISCARILSACPCLHTSHPLKGVTLLAIKFFFYLCLILAKVRAGSTAGIGKNTSFDCSSGIVGSFFVFIVETGTFHKV